MNLFVYGTLRVSRIFDLVVGEKLAFEKAHLGPVTIQGLRAYYVEGQVYPALRKEENFVLEGDLLKIDSSLHFERLMEYEDPTNYEMRNFVCQRDSLSWDCGVFWPLEKIRLSDRPWSYEKWCKNQDLDAYIRSFSTS